MIILAIAIDVKWFKVDISMQYDFILKFGSWTFLFHTWCASKSPFACAIDLSSLVVAALQGIWDIVHIVNVTDILVHLIVVDEDDIFLIFGRLHQTFELFVIFFKGIGHIFGRIVKYSRLIVAQSLLQRVLLGAAFVLPTRSQLFWLALFQLLVGLSYMSVQIVDEDWHSFDLRLPITTAPLR